MIGAGSAALALVSVWGASVAVVDTVRHRIPNVLLILLLVPDVLALVFSGHGLLNVSPRSSLEGALLGFGLSFPGYLLGKVGAGDVKLCFTLGLVAGLDATLHGLGCAAVILGVVALGVVAVRWRQGRHWRFRIPAGAGIVAGILGYVYWGASL